MRTSLGRVVFVVVAVAVIAVSGQNIWSQSASPNPGLGAAAPDSDIDEDLLSALTPLDRQILKFVNQSQLDQLRDGTDPADIFLSNGETLSVLAAKTQEETSRNLFFAPVAPCRLLDTRRAPEGYLLAGETRGFRVRETENGYAAQGGAEEGCGLPGLDGVTLKTNAVRAIALNVLTVDVGGPGSLAIWPANRSEPEIGSVSFASALAGGGVTGGVLVPLCDEVGFDPCSAADFKIKAKLSGSHVVAELVGYFHASPSRAALQIDETPEQAGDATGQAGGAEQPGGFDVSPDARLPGRVTASRSPLGGQRVAAPAQDAIPRVDHMLPLEGDKAGPNAKAGEYEISLRGELATGHGAGAAVYGWIPNDTFNFLAAAVKGHATTGNAVHGEAPNGRAVYGKTEDGYAVYGFDGGSSPNRGYAGFFYSTNGIGVYGYSNGNRAHPNIYAPGVYGQSNQGVGVCGRGDTSNSYSFYNEGGYFEGGKGLYARGTDSAGEQGYGARIFSSQYRGMYAQGASGFYDAYFGGTTGISANGIIDRSGKRVVLAVNLGARAIRPGDLIAIVGTAPSPENGQPIIGVSRLDAHNSEALIGVAQQAYEVTIIKQPDSNESTNFSPVKGVAEPQQYLAIVTGGLMPAVNLDNLPLLPGRKIGDKVALQIGTAVEVGDAQLKAVTLGKVASAPDLANGTIAIFIDID
ncbi:MAG: hypothetical protein QNL88_14145 [Acidobacteriota bacterium]|nr:hypothetical protein [Acidobacteriota bacterium]